MQSAHSQVMASCPANAQAAPDLHKEAAPEPLPVGSVVDCPVDDFDAPCRDGFSATIRGIAR